MKRILIIVAASAAAAGGALGGAALAGAQDNAGPTGPTGQNGQQQERTAPPEGARDRGDCPEKDGAAAESGNAEALF